MEARATATKGRRREQIAQVSSSERILHLVTATAASMLLAGVRTLATTDTTHPDADAAYRAARFLIRRRFAVHGVVLEKGKRPRLVYAPPRDIDLAEFFAIVVEIVVNAAEQLEEQCGISGLVKASFGRVG
jgi:hypothetical protein